MKAYFIKDKNSNYFKSSIFTSILNFVSLNSQNCNLKEKSTLNGSKLVLTIKKIENIDKALLFLENIKS